MKTPRNPVPKEDDYKPTTKKSQALKDALESEKREKKELEECLKLYK